MLQKITTTPTGTSKIRTRNPMRQWWRIRREEAKGRGRAKILHEAVQAIRALDRGTVPGAELLEKLREGMGDPVRATEPGYLEEVARHAVSAERPILQCGTGVTTLLIALLAGSRGVPIYCLEHQKDRADGIRRAIDELGIGGAEFLHAPLISYGDFHWYSAPLYLLPDQFDLVICEGPPERGTHGGRHGLMSVMGGRFDRGTKILVDDAATPTSAKMLDHWCRTGRWCSKLNVPGERGTALLTRADADVVDQPMLPI